MVSIDRPLGYGPSTLPLRHPASQPASTHTSMSNTQGAYGTSTQRVHRIRKQKGSSRRWFRSIDLWVMGPARFHCATLLAHTHHCLIHRAHTALVLQSPSNKRGQQQMVSIHRPLGYGPSTLPLRHPASQPASTHTSMSNTQGAYSTSTYRVHQIRKQKGSSRRWFRSIDLWVMGPARFHCATLLAHTHHCLIHRAHMAPVLRESIE